MTLRDVHDGPHERAEVVLAPFSPSPWARLVAVLRFVVEHQFPVGGL